MQVIRFGPEQANSISTKTVFLHGFPGVRSKQNRDLVEALALNNHCPVDLLLYEGLGQVTGQFSFENCLRDVRGYFSQIDRPCYLVGHSWGGFLSLVMANAFPDIVRKVVLMSPLLSFIGEDLASPWFKEIATEHPNLDFLDHKILAGEFTRVGQLFPPKQLIQNLSKDCQVRFLQAKDDPITPTEIADEMKSLFPCPLEFSLLETDHSFLLNRDLAEKEIIRFLK